ncbi:hypothetical protein BJ138DRAFT_1128303 [Hygrophoropsis aurantiaca]|uniref:Uncharacterized protein n=1 Tax=Hygrophoropsis aurantiaca TaxID=72124 RepID=A0ACB8A579_9AGAM|nr:hypothetical protein BJ138DRAFT_1128303 [Hygrophoropsis aurantiaca]
MNTAERAAHRRPNPHTLTRVQRGDGAHIHRGEGTSASVSAGASASVSAGASASVSAGASASASHSIVSGPSHSSAASGRTQTQTHTVAKKRRSGPSSIPAPSSAHVASSIPTQSIPILPSTPSTFLLPSTLEAHDARGKPKSRSRHQHPHPHPHQHPHQNAHTLALVHQSQNAPRPPPPPTEINDSHAHRVKKRERSKSRESARSGGGKDVRGGKEVSGRDSHSSGAKDTVHDAAEYTGPLAAAEFTRLKRENEALKKQSHENKKVIKKQTKVIEELKQRETTNIKLLKDAEHETQRVKTQAKKSEEVLDTIETNTQCQICMDLLFKPYALSPCGHVLCLICLQSWFRRAPSSDSEVEMFNDDTSDLNMHDPDDDDEPAPRRADIPWLSLSAFPQRDEDPAAVRALNQHLGVGSPGPRGRQGDRRRDRQQREYLLYRRKTCPCCRAAVRHRPIPVFVVKAVASALAKVRTTGGMSPGGSGSGNGNATEGDPWEGLFPPENDNDGDEEFTYNPSDDDSNFSADDDESVSQSDDESGESGDDLDELDLLSDYEDAEGGAVSDDSDVFNYGSPRAHGRDGLHYVRPQWEPPSVLIDADDYLFAHLPAGTVDVLRRGGTLAMQEAYELAYEHGRGLVLLLRIDVPRQLDFPRRGSGARAQATVRVYLGWNICLSADDEAGDRFVQWVAGDMTERPERWEVRPTQEREVEVEAWMLLRETEVVEYSDTDSDNYGELDD